VTETREHWDRVYKTKRDDEVSWYQLHPERSLALIREAARDRTKSIIDIGGGASRLVDELVAAGYSDVTVLDVSSVALSHAQARLGQKAEAVNWIVADITQWRPHRAWAVWHDRAVFHFLTETALQDAYVAALSQATTAGSTIILATFALDGPERCSGLPVQRYSPQTLAARLGEGFALGAEAAERHRTPAGAIQSFAYSVFKRC
jgi:SAM-dependent methyltransferase